MQKLFSWYEHNLVRLAIIPIIIVVICLGLIAFKYATTGDVISRDVTLKGGAIITVTESTDIAPETLKEKLHADFPAISFDVRSIGQVGSLSGLTIQADTGDQQTITSILNSVSSLTGPLDESQYSIEIIGSGLGQNFFREALIAVIIAFAFMGLTVMLYFRDFFPSLYIIFAAFGDIVFPFAIMSIFEIKLSTAGIAAFLMLIGYSVDTDILLTSRVLRSRDGSVMERIRSAMPTGLTMTFTALAVTLIAYFFSQADTLKSIMLILSLGLAFDLFTTWLTNAGLLRWYIERKEKRHA